MLHSSSVTEGNMPKKKTLTFQFMVVVVLLCNIKDQLCVVFFFLAVQHCRKPSWKKSMPSRAILEKAE